MTYASTSDLKERMGAATYVQLTDDEGTGQADEDKAVEALEGAEGEVNSYLGRRYAVPVELTGEASTAAVLKSITLDLAEYRLHARRLIIPEDVRRKREAAVRWLEEVASGRAVLPSVDSLESNAATGPGGFVTGSERTFSRESMEGL